MGRSELRIECDGKCACCGVMWCEVGGYASEWCVLGGGSTDNQRKYGAYTYI